MAKSLRLDRFGNAHAPGLPYARGAILASTADDIAKLRTAWSVIQARYQRSGAASVYNFSGLERCLRCKDDDLPHMDDEIAPALYGDGLKSHALEHLGGQSPIHDIALLNRTTAGIVAAMLSLARPGDTVVGVAPSYSHPCVGRAAARAGARFVDAADLDTLRTVLDQEANVPLVILTRLAVSYEVLDLQICRDAVALARTKGALVMLDDAGGARVGPAVFDQPRSLELGVDVAVTGLDKYGVTGPRLGLLGGLTDLVADIRATAWELGLEARPMLYPAALQSLEAYRPEKVREMVAATRAFASDLSPKLDGQLFETPVSVQIRGEDILDMALARSGQNDTSLVPYEATAALAMLLLRNSGILTVHFAGVPPGTSALMFKFISPETLSRFGGPAALAHAVEAALSELATIIGEPEAVRRLLFEEAD
ncbi:MAG: hypothetical protein MJE12_02785 [Alphaproteobacteria bacterium]|nr:hypothetical protein [Alphaproteobacteria bacterium]